MDRKTIAGILIAAVGLGVLFVVVVAVIASRPRAPASSTPAPAVSAAAPEEWTDERRLEWLVNQGWTANDLVNRECFALSQCSNLASPGELGAPTTPAGIAPCIERERAGCADVERSLRARDLATMPPEFQPFIADLIDAAGFDVCYADARLHAIHEHPEVVGQLRRSADLVDGPMREHLHGWESLEAWALDDEEVRPAWVSGFDEALADCDERFPNAFRPHFADVTAWLRERFDCTPVGGLCTLDRAHEMAVRGLPFGPAPPR